MTQPAAYNITTDFSQDEASAVSGRSTVRTANLDAEFANLQTTIAQIRVNLALLQRDDTALMDSIVTVASLSSDVLALLSSSAFEARGPWLTATVYAVGDVVSESAKAYLCMTAHTSGVFATDLAAGKWVIIGTSTAAIGVSFTPAAGLGSTNVQAAIQEIANAAALNVDNLSELDDAEDARENLGAGSGGVWPVSLGGTGAETEAEARSSLQVVGIETDEEITGAKTFISQAIFDAGALIVDMPASGFSAVNVSRLRGYIVGLTYNPSGTDDIVMDVGVAAADSFSFLMSLSAALTKKSDVAFAPGDNEGMLDTGAAANADYFLWLIWGAGVGVDVLSSLSNSAPTMPASFTHKRLFGWFRRAAGNVVAFRTYALPGGGLHYCWDAPPEDIDLTATITTSRHLDVLSVPLGFKVEVDLSLTASDSAAQSITCRCPDETDAAPSLTATPGCDLFVPAGGSAAGSHTTRTNTSGEVASRSSSAGLDTYHVYTKAFRWAR